MCGNILPQKLIYWSSWLPIMELVITQSSDFQTLVPQSRPWPSWYINKYGIYFVSGDTFKFLITKVFFSLKKILKIWPANRKPCPTLQVNAEDQRSRTTWPSSLGTKRKSHSQVYHLPPEAGVFLGSQRATINHCPWKRKWKTLEALPL